jgi:hypothetical protein
MHPLAHPAVRIQITPARQGRQSISILVSTGDLQVNVAAINPRLT